MASHHQHCSSGNRLPIPLAHLLLMLVVLSIPLLAALPVSADWGTEVPVVTTPSDQPEIDASGNYVHLVWVDYRDGVGKVYYKRSTDWGRTWGAETRLTSHNSWSWAPDIEVSGSTIHVAYTDNQTGNEEIYYKRSGDSGLTWGPEVRLSNSAGYSVASRLSSSGSNAYVTWEADASLGNGDISFVRSIDDGRTWGPVQVLNHIAGKASSPDIAASGSTVNVLWDDTRSGTSQIYYQQSTDYGQTWRTADTALTTDVTSYGPPTVKASAGAVNVMYSKGVLGGVQLWTSRSPDNGLSWIAPVRLDGGSGPAAYPEISAVTNKVHIAWLDKRDGGNGQIYYKRSNDAGQTWSSDTRLTTNAVPTAGYPTIVAAANNVYVVWADLRDNPSSPHLYLKTFTGAPAASAVNSPLGIVSFTASDGLFSTLSAVNVTSMTCVPAGYMFPYGLFSFNITNLAPGETITVIITLPNSMPPAMTYFKCQDGRAVDCSAFTTIVDASTIKLTLTDGGPADSDHLANGTISDPGGPASPVYKNSPRGASVPSTPQAPVALSNIKVQSASLSATKVTPGTPVTITAQVANNGAANGATRIALYVNGQEESGQAVTISSGSSIPVTFTVTRNQPGTYSVYVGGEQAGSFTVDELADPNLILFASLGALALVLILGTVYFTRRRNQVR